MPPWGLGPTAVRHGPRRSLVPGNAARRVRDIGVAVAGLIGTAPITGPLAFAIWLFDGGSPFYLSTRVGRDGVSFRMIKFRTMIVNADQAGPSSTASDDTRLTLIGSVVRCTKLDELPQLWNVLRGDMSLVGPRPNVREQGTDLYTNEEQQLLSIRPGVTDFASIVFADEGEILAGHADPNEVYQSLIRPYKSQLGLVYVRNRSLRLDTQIVALTLLGMVSRRRALAGVNRALRRLGTAPDLVRVAARVDPLLPSQPPGRHSRSGIDSRATRVIDLREGRETVVEAE